MADEKDQNGVDPKAATDQAPPGPGEPQGDDVPAEAGRRVVTPITPDDQKRLNDRGTRCMQAAIAMNPSYGGAASHCTILEQPNGGRVEVYNILLVRDRDGKALIERFIFMDQGRLVRLS